MSLLRLISAININQEKLCRYQSFGLFWPLLLTNPPVKWLFWAIFHCARLHELVLTVC